MESVLRFFVRTTIQRIQWEGIPWSRFTPEDAPIARATKLNEKWTLLRCSVVFFLKIPDRNDFMRVKFAFGARQYARAILLATAFFLCACANTGRIQHGIQIESKGPRSIYDVRVNYGEGLIRFRSIYGEGQGSGQGVIHPVPESMKLTWFVGGQPQEAIVPLKSNLSRHPLRNWVLKFYGERLEVWREEQTGPTNAYGIQPRQEVKVYP